MKMNNCCDACGDILNPDECFTYCKFCENVDFSYVEELEERIRKLENLLIDLQNK